MYIDFHTHAFSDKIVERAMSQLSQVSQMEPYTDGTIGGLKDFMKQNGIDGSVLLPIATKPTQQTIVNNWAAEVNRDGIYSFGSVHPDADDALEELERIKELGLYGLKLHPDYQGFMADDEKLFPIYKKCAELGLPVIFHAGYDPLSPEKIHGNPEAFAEICRSFPSLTVILAHMGGMYLWDRVERHLAGKFENLYFDTGVIAGEIGTELLLRIIKKHSADRILFASDCPWDDPKNEIAMINALDLPIDDKEKIFYKNAKKLLKI